MLISGPPGRRSGRSTRLSGWMRVAATVVIGAGALWGGLSGHPALGRGDSASTTQTAPAGTVLLAQLPPEARQTHRLILAGGPFPYDKDGSVFGNRERLLPDRPRGHYREYTVRTPGSRDRGARRLVCGGRPPTLPEACYYTDDHYASFRLVAQ